MSIEDELRVTLQERAGRSAGGPDPDLWESVTAGVWRRRRRQRAVAVGTAALALAAVAVLPPLLSRRAQPTPDPPAVTPTVEWVTPQWPRPDFPLRPSWVPAEVADDADPVVSRLGPNAHLSWERDTSVLSAEVGPLQAAWEVEATDIHPTSVNGRPGVVHAADSFDGALPGETYVGVRWQLADKRWVQVLSFGKRTEAEVLRFARGLSSGSVPAARPPYVFDVVPPGHTLQFQSLDVMCVAPAAAPPERQPSGICTQVTGDDEPGVPGERGTVNGNLATYYGEAGLLDVQLTGGRTLQVQWPTDEPGSLTMEEALRFATGIHVLLD